MPNVVPVNRMVVTLDKPVVIATKYRRNGEPAKDKTLYVVAYAIVRNHLRLLATTDPANVSDGSLFLFYADSCSKLAKHTTITPWDIAPEVVEGVLDNLYYFQGWDPAYSQVQQLVDADEQLEAVAGHGAEPFADIQVASAQLSLIVTDPVVEAPAAVEPAVEQAA